LKAKKHKKLFGAGTSAIAGYGHQIKIIFAKKHKSNHISEAPKLNIRVNHQIL
jgi:hypothetical protein